VLATRLRLDRRFERALLYEVPAAPARGTVR
jgi:hypothetical protein